MNMVCWTTTVAAAELHSASTHKAYYCIYLNIRWPCMSNNHPSWSSILRKITIWNMLHFVGNYKVSPTYFRWWIMKKFLSCIHVNVVHCICLSVTLKQQHLAQTNVHKIYQLMWTWFKSLCHSTESLSIIRIDLNTYTVHKTCCRL
jgi:hypothetical protein